ncbi:DMT family transporter [Candidatus Margulisiibacteriota bacterium]
MPERSPDHGSFIMFLSAFMFSIMAVSVKFASQSVSASEIIFFRCIISVAIILLMALMGKADLKPHSMGLLIFRGLAGATGLTFYFHAVSLTTLSNAVLLTYTFPIFAAIYSSFLLKEYLTKQKIMLIFLAFFGIAMIFGFNFANVGIGDIFALTAGVINGMVITSVRQLRKTDSAWVIVFSFVLAGSIASFSMMGFRLPALTTAALLPLLFVGIFGTLGQLLMSYAFKACSTALGGIIQLSSVVITIILSYFIFKEPLTVFMVVGGLLVFWSAASFSSKEKCAITHS